MFHHFSRILGFVSQESRVIPNKIEKKPLLSGFLNIGTQLPIAPYENRVKMRLRLFLPLLSATYLYPHKLLLFSFVIVIIYILLRSHPIG